MADMILTPIAELIIETLGSAAVEEIKSLYGARDELSKLEETLKTIRAVLVDAEKRQIREEQVRDWLEKLEAVFFDADDLVDGVNAERLLRKLMPTRNTLVKKVRTFFSSNNQLVFRHKLASQIKDIRERLDAISADKERFHFVNLPEEIQPGRRVRDDSYSFVVKENVVGRDKDRTAIVELLLNPENGAHQEKVSVIPIVGMGGLGKTTLAQLVFNDEKVQQHFELKIWVCVSNDFTVKVLCEKIIKIITNEKVENLEMEQLQIKLRQQINEKRYLLVLDDVWSEGGRKWKELKDLLTANCSKGSRIIVTTRLHTVAKVMSTMQPYDLGILDSEDSWNLFKKMADHERLELPNQMVDIAKGILAKCAGLPLAISMIGSVLLSSRNPEIEWPSFLEKELSNIPQGENEILPTLRLSFDVLPSHLKACFAYCGLFPKDHEFDVQTLITLWLAQGFIRSDQSQSPEEIGYEYFEDLLWRSFFQEAKTDGVLNMVTTCKMHDLVHDLAIQVAGEKYALLASCEENLRKSVRHIYFDVSSTYSFVEIPSSWLQGRRIRSFLFPSKFLSFQWIGDSKQDEVISNLKFLRTLDLSIGLIETVTDSIGKLKHLRYLDLSTNYKIKTLPASITKLVNLQTLKLNWCYGLCELPSDIENLVNLRHLELTGCDSVTHMPRGLSQLTNLQTISLVVLSENVSNGPYSKLDELMGMENLSGEVKIKGITSGMVTKASKLRENNRLRSLHLNFERGEDDESKWKTTLEGLQPHPNLKELSLDQYGCSSLSGFLPTLTNLVKLFLENCSKCQQLPSLDKFHSLKEMSLNTLPSLEFITINEGDNYFSTSSSPPVSVLPSLQKLTLVNLPEFRGWWRSGMPEQPILPSFPRLSSLKIEGCEKLTSMPRYPNIEGELELRNTSWKTFEQTSTAEEASSSSSIPTIVSVSLYPLSKLTSLSFIHVEDLKYFPNERMKGLASLKKLEISDCPALKYLSLWILYLNSLEELKIDSCKAFEGIKWPKTSTLTRLRVLKLERLPKLKDVFTPDIQCLTSLEELKIEICEGLEEFKLTPALPRLRVLKLWWLPKLKYDLVLDIQCLTSLEELKIDSCKAFEGIKWPETPTLTRLRVLNLYELPKLKDVFDPDIQCLTSLEELEIHSCEELEEIKLTPALTRLRVLKLNSLPKLKNVFALDIQCLTSLEELEIDSCYEGLEEIKLTHALPRLRVLQLKGLPKLKYVFAPDIQCLTSLEELEIEYCEGLEEIKLTPALSRLRVLKLHWLPELKDVFAPDIQCLTSLEELKIETCWRLGEIKLIPALPRLRVLTLIELPLKYVFTPDIQHLTSLEELQIHSCIGLEEIKLTPALPRLRVLNLDELPKLKHLSCPGVQQHLTSLEELRIIGCEELQVSNDDSIEWQALTTLRSLKLSWTPQLVSLPRGLQFLTTLKELHIWNCPNFTGLPDWICKLSSLETLYIWSCSQFKSVPASISSLTSLQKLEINGKGMNPREIHEDLDLSCSASGSRSWKILKKFRQLQLCNK